MTDEMIDRAVTCMMAFLPLDEEEASPIFSHYFHGLAFIAKSDVYYNLDQIARQCLHFQPFRSFARYGGWNGEQEE